MNRGQENRGTREQKNWGAGEQRDENRVTGKQGNRRKG